MKCPKCGYNSFDYLDSCKKCNKDLTEHKARFNIQSILLSEMPVEAVSSVAEEVVAAATTSTNVSLDDFAGGGTASETDDFGFDFMGDSDDDENLAFDELFEEVPSEDDVEESLPEPEAPTKAAPPTTKAPSDNFAASGDEDDDFGYDFTGDSGEEKEFAFDELFEEVPSEDDVEESLPAPKTVAKQAVPLDNDLANEKTSTDAFSFDETEPKPASKVTTTVTPTSPSEFGFDAEDDPAADIFAESEEDFSLDATDLEDTDKKS